MLYNWLLAFHVISIICWMAALLYLPRLFVYHASAPKGGELSETLKVMERRLDLYIMNPALIASFLTGEAMSFLHPDLFSASYMHAKMALVFLLVIVHVLLMRWRRIFARDANIHDHKFYRVVNEVPTLLMIGIVIMVIVKPMLY